MALFPMVTGGGKSGFAVVYDINNNQLTQTKNYTSINDYVPSISSKWIGVYIDTSGNSLIFKTGDNQIIAQIDSVNASNGTVTYTYRGNYYGARIMFVLYD